jgi:hypothetical protein
VWDVDVQLATPYESCLQKRLLHKQKTSHIVIHDYFIMWVIIYNDATQGCERAGEPMCKLPRQLPV